MDATEADIDLEMIQKFKCMGTTDKDTLISGFQLSPAGCALFLDMTNWNLQAAILVYYDFESPSSSAPFMSFVKEGVKESRFHQILL